MVLIELDRNFFDKIFFIYFKRKVLRLRKSPQSIIKCGKYARTANQTINNQQIIRT